jgi:hypothetical protein
MTQEKSSSTITDKRVPANRLMRILWPLMIVVVAGVCGCSEVHHETTVLGVRTNQQGEASQQVVRERVAKSRPALGPDGPTHRTESKDKYFVQGKDQSRREVPLTREDEFRHCGVYRPVEGSPLWVGAGFNPVSNQNTGHVAVINGIRGVSHNENDLHIVVFDENRIVIHRTFNVVPKWESSVDEFSFTNGNRTVIFHSPEGFKAYDVQANTVTSQKE